MSKPKNPTAFPGEIYEIQGTKDTPTITQFKIGNGNGMTLLDYFAARALQGILSQPPNERYTAQDIVEGVYRWADLMLEEREKHL